MSLHFETFELVVGYEDMRAAQLCRKQFAPGLLGGVLSVGILVL